MNLLKKLSNYVFKSKPIVEEMHPVTENDCNKNKVMYNTVTNTVTVVFKDGDILEGTIDAGQYKQLNDLCSKSEILSLLQPKPYKVESDNYETKEQEIVKNAYNSLNVLTETSMDFVIEGSRVYLQGVKSIELPPIIVAEFIRICCLLQETGEQGDWLSHEEINMEYEALLAFSYKLLLNPLENSREQLLTFVKNNDIRITKTGNLVLYRACFEGEANDNSELVKYVAKEYLKIKAWKKSPKNYRVVKPTGEKDYRLVDLSFDVINSDLICLGTLDFLYNDLPKMQTGKKQYYSWHGKKKIVLGDIYKIDEKDIDLNASVCHSGGIHSASCNYDYSGYGNVNLVVLVNPAKALTVPYEDCGKIRVTEMFIVGINPNGLGVHINDGAFHDFDENYHNYSIEELKNALQTKSLGDLSIQTENSGLNLNEISSIKDVLINRIITV